MQHPAILFALKVSCPFYCVTSIFHALENTGQISSISGFLQLIFLGPWARQQVETYPRSELNVQTSEVRKIQNGDSRNYKNLPSDMRMSNVHRLQGRLLSYLNESIVQEIPSHPRLIQPNHWRIPEFVEKVIRSQSLAYHT